MTNQIKTSWKHELWRDSVQVRTSPLKNISIDTTSELFSETTQVVGTTHELIAAGDITDDMMCVVENLHATATVTIGGDDAAVFVPWMSIPAGYPSAVLPIVSAIASTYIKSDTASTPVRITLMKIV